MRDVIKVVVGSGGVDALVVTMQDNPLGAALLIALVLALGRAGARSRRTRRNKR